MMKKYEYLCVSIFGPIKKATEILNKHGEEGWELVGVFGTWHYFKREKQMK